MQFYFRFTFRDVRTYDPCRALVRECFNLINAQFLRGKSQQGTCLPLDFITTVKLGSASFIQSV